MINIRNKKGFTLLELLIVIIILGVLATLISGFFFNSLKKGRDARRKEDLKGMQTALESYFEDKRSYPTTDQIIPGNPICETNPSQDCGSEKMYLKKIPEESTSLYKYSYVSDGTYYILYSTLEYDEDSGRGVKKSGFDGTDCGDGKCQFGISSPNVYLEDDMAISQAGGTNPGVDFSATPTSGVGGGPTSAPSATCPDGYLCANSSTGLSCAAGSHSSSTDVPGACSEFESCFTCVDDSPSDGGQICAQVLTSAVNSSGTCQVFPDSCIPAGWTAVPACPTPTPTFGIGGGINNY